LHRSTSPVPAISSLGNSPGKCPLNLFFLINLIFFALALYPKVISNVPCFYSVKQFSPKRDPCSLKIVTICWQRPRDALLEAPPLPSIGRPFESKPPRRTAALVIRNRHLRSLIGQFLYDILEQPSDSRPSLFPLPVQLDDELVYFRGKPCSPGSQGRPYGPFIYLPLYPTSTPPIPSTSPPPSTPPPPFTHPPPLNILPPRVSSPTPHLPTPLTPTPPPLHPPHPPSPHPPSSSPSPFYLSSALNQPLPPPVPSPLPYPPSPRSPPRTPFLP